MDSAEGEEQTVLSRRDFLRLGAAGLASLALRPLPPEDESSQDLFYRIAASALPEQPAPPPGPEYYHFPGKKSELLGVHRALTAAEKLEAITTNYPSKLEAARQACRELTVNPAIWTDGLIQPLADWRRINEHLKKLGSFPWETGNSEELLQRWFELNRRDKPSVLDAASLESPRADTVGAAILRWSGESSGRFPTQLVNFSAEDKREIAKVLASFPEEVLAKIVADESLEVNGTFNLEYGEPVIRLQSELFAGELSKTTWEFFKLYFVFGHEFIHGLDIWTNKNLWLILPPPVALQLVTLRAQIAGRYLKLFKDPSPFTQPEGGQQTGLLVEFMFNSKLSDLPPEPALLRRLASRYGWLIARFTSQDLSEDEVRRLLWTPAGASGNLTQVTDAWSRYQIESFAETAAALISLRQLRGVDLTKWWMEPELQYFRLMGNALARQKIYQVPLGEVFRQSKPNVR